MDAVKAYVKVRAKTAMRAPPPSVKSILLNKVCRSTLVIMSQLIALCIGGAVHAEPAQNPKPVKPVEKGQAVEPVSPQPAGKKSNKTANKKDQSRKRIPNPHNLVGHGGPVKTIAVHDDGKHALTGSFDYSMIYWDMSQSPPKPVQRFDSHNAAVNAVAFVPEKNLALAAADDGTLSLWDLKSFERKKLFNGHTTKIVALAISKDGQWAATASWDRTVRLWDLTNLKNGPVLNGHQGPVNAVAFAHFEDKPVVYTASYDGQVRQFDRNSGSLKRVVYKHGFGINALDTVNGGQDLIFGSLNGETGLIDCNSGELKKKFPTRKGPVLAIATSKDKGQAAIAGADGVVQIWAIGQTGLLETHQNPYGPVWALAFSANGNAVYYGGLDDFVTHWSINPRKRFETVDSPYPRRFQVGKAVPLGERQFARKCSICHTLEADGENRAGPTLFNLFGRKAGTIAGYSYSKALKTSDIIWDERTVAALFEQGPDDFIPGSKMPLQKITDPAKIKALVAYLKEATQATGKEKSTPTKDEVPKSK